jgi:uncharacterized protein
VIYTDTSALAKLIRPEAETEALRAWLEVRKGVPRATNQIGVVELKRFSARIGPDFVSLAVALVRRLDRLDLTPTTFSLAEDVSPLSVRTLDALHVASAAELPELHAFLTYDLRMAEAARSFGLPVESPA